jgi:hypothetical protein
MKDRNKALVSNNASRLTRDGRNPIKSKLFLLARNSHRKRSPLTRCGSGHFSPIKHSQEGP